MAKDYFVNEGNKLGYMNTYFGNSANNSLSEDKLVADGDITKGQVVMLSDSMKVKVASAAGGANVIGVAMFDAKDGEPVAVECEGLFRLTAGDSITAPAQVSAGDDGKVVAATAPTVSAGTYSAGTKVIGIALNDASSGDEVYVKFSI